MTKYLVPFLSGLLGAIIFTAVHNRLYSQTIGVVRMDELISSHVQERGINEMPQDQIDTNAKNFGSALDASLKAISTEYNVVLLVNPAVVSSAPDYTDIVKADIAKRLDSGEYE